MSHLNSFLLSVNDAPLVALGFLLAGFLIALGVSVRFAGWVFRHPVFVGFALLSVAATSVDARILLGWWALVAVVWSVLVAERSEHDKAGWWLILGACRTVTFVFRHLAAVAHLVVTGILAWFYGLVGVVGLWGLLGALYGAWAWRRPASFERAVVSRARAAWRSVSVYWPRWDRTLRSIRGLTVKADGQVVVPRRLSLTSGRWVDRLRVQLLPGQAASDWEQASEKVAASFGAHVCRVRRVAPELHEVDLLLRRGDPLKEVIPAPSPVPVLEHPTLGVDLSGLPVGLFETGELWPMPVLGAHVLIAGASGAGKGSVIGSIVNAVAPLVPEGLVEMYGLDPKGGIELSLYKDLWTVLEYQPAAMVELLDWLTKDMSSRGDEIRGHARRYTLNGRTPHKLIFIDEFAFLTAYMGDKKLREQANRLINILLTQGRALGYTVIGALQDPRKEVLPMRDLFTIRVALRLLEADMVDPVLGEGAYQRGAWCDQIPRSTPGVGYVVLDGDAEPERFRAYWVSDNHIAHLSNDFAAPAQVIDITTATTTQGVEFDDDDQDDTGAWSA